MPRIPLHFSFSTPSSPPLPFLGPRGRVEGRINARRRATRPALQVLQCHERGECRALSAQRTHRQRSPHAPPAPPAPPAYAAATSSVASRACRGAEELGAVHIASACPVPRRNHIPLRGLCPSGNACRGPSRAFRSAARQVWIICVAGCGTWWASTLIGFWNSFYIIYDGPYPCAKCSGYNATRDGPWYMEKNDWANVAIQVPPRASFRPGGILPPPTVCHPSSPPPRAATSRRHLPDPTGTSSSSTT